MAQFYNLDEASARLGVTPEEFKRKLRDEWKSVRSFRDGATLRFRAADIDELARTLGAASDPGLPLGDAAPLSDSSEELSLEPPKTPASKPKVGSGRNLNAPSGKNLKPPANKPKVGADAPLFLGDDSDDIFALPSDDAKPKSKPRPGAKTDSDVRLDQTPAAGGGGGGATEEIELELPPASGVGLGKSSAKLTGPKSSGKLAGGGAKIPGPTDSPDDGSSEFELSLDSDSDSFELQLTDDSSEEDALGGTVLPGGGAQSGINLGRPSDSGVSLEKKSRPPVTPDDSDGSFELELDPPTGGPKSRPIPSAANSGGGMTDEGSSEFELTLDDSDGSESMNALAADAQTGGDIFETDFELPVMDGDESGSEVLQVDSADTDLENSDFDLAIDEGDAPADDESASQVVLMDDEPLVDGDEAVALEDEPAVVEDDDDHLAALGGRTRTVVETRTEVVEKVVPPPPPRWGLVPVLALAPTFLIVVFGSLMGFEVIRSMAGYQQPAAAPIVRPIAKDVFKWPTGD